jgi:hypothetical protein
MSDVKSKDGKQPDIARRKAVTYLALGAAGLAAVGVMAPKRAEAMYGRCWKCNCCGFEGSSDQCSNCGHNYSDHSGATCMKDHDHKDQK